MRVISKAFTSSAFNSLPTANCPLPTVSLDGLQQVLHRLVDCRDDARVSLKASLRDDQINELAGDINVALLEHAADNCATTTAARSADRRLARSNRLSEQVAASVRERALGIESGNRYLADGLGLPVVEDGGDAALVINRDAGHDACAETVLRCRGDGRLAGEVCDERLAHR